MSYVQQNLITGETVRYNTRCHWIVLFWPSAIVFLMGFTGILSIASGDGTMIVVGLFSLLVAAAAFGLAYAVRSASEFAITDKRVIVKVGLIKQRTVEMFLNKIESIGVVQGLFGRIIGYGTIVVRGTGGTPEPFDTVPDPLEFRRQVQEQIDRMNPVAGLPAGR